MDTQNMQTTTATLNPAARFEKSWTAVFADLVKARLTTLVLLTTLVGFYLGGSGAMNDWLLFHALVGTGAGGGRRGRA